MTLGVTTYPLCLSYLTRIKGIMQYLPCRIILEMTQYISTAYHCLAQHLAPSRLSINDAGFTVICRLPSWVKTHKGNIWICAVVLGKASSEVSPHGDGSCQGQEQGWCWWASQAKAPTPVLGLCCLLSGLLVGVWFLMLGE